MDEKYPVSESVSFLSKHLDRYDPIAADLCAFGMGNWEDFQRHLVVPLQSSFSKEMYRDDGGWHIPLPPGEPLLHHTLHGWLLDFFLECAGALRFAFGKCSLPDFFHRDHR